MSDEINWSAFGAALEQAGEAIQKFGEAIIDIMGSVLPLVEKMQEALYQDEPMPGEEPVDFVMRVGARSGFFIYPDEAWRYRANLDWWHERKQKGQE